MPFSVKIPALGESITRGILAKWHVADGAVVKKGQALFDLETDKITSEGAAETSGQIRLKVAPGTEVEIGAVVAEIDESVTAAAEAAPAASAEGAKPAEGKPQSPAVRALAAETGINPDTLAGSGKEGRVTKGDMLAAAAKPAALATPAPAAAPKAAAPSTPASPAAAPASAAGRVTRKKMTPMRRKIAERLVAAQHNAAILTTFNEVNMAPVMELRKKHQDAFVARHGVKLGFMSFFVKAVVHGLQAVPALNAQIEGDEIIENNFFDIGVAVSTPKGLLVPVVRGCERLSFAEIEKAIIAYGQKAKDGKIAIEDLQGGVFTITNGGIFGSMLSTPIINPPQSGILGMHAIKDRPMAEDGQVVIRPMMYLALSYDHRLVDGREAVTFLVKVKEALEDPSRLLFGI